jgi:hypothetical protein
MNFHKNQYRLYKPSILKVKECIEKNNLQLRKDNQIIFLFGAKPNKEKPTARDTFFQYSKKHLTQYKFLLAEDFFEFINLENKDLLSIEKELAYYTDCLIILMESPGAFSELGAFAMDKSLVKIILAINKSDYKIDSNSFISLGPLKRIENKSKFGKPIYSNFKSILQSVDEVESRLSKFLRKKAKTVRLNNYEEFNKKENKKYRLLLLSDLITIFGPITDIELTNILKDIYLTPYIKIDIELNLLKSIKLIDVKDNFFYKTYENEFYFYKYNEIDIFKVRFDNFNYYAKIFPDRIKIFS